MPSDLSNLLRQRLIRPMRPTPAKKDLADVTEHGIPDATASNDVQSPNPAPPTNISAMDEPNRGGAKAGEASQRDPDDLRTMQSLGHHDRIQAPVLDP
eukprot:1277009-Alexandrium_andersonii.AAC.1